MQLTSTMRFGAIAAALVSVATVAHAASIITVATSAGLLSVNTGSSGSSPAPIQAYTLSQSGSFPSATGVLFTGKGATGTITLTPSTTFKSGVYVSNTPGSHGSAVTSAQAVIPAKTLVLNKTKIAYDVSAQLSLNTSSADNRFSDFPLTATLTAVDKSGATITIGTAQILAPSGVAGQAVNLVGRSATGFVPVQFSLSLSAAAPKTDAANGAPWPATVVYSSDLTLQRLTLRPVLSTTP